MAFQIVLEEKVYGRHFNFNLIPSKKSSFQKWKKSMVFQIVIEEKVYGGRHLNFSLILI